MIFPKFSLKSCLVFFCVICINTALYAEDYLIKNVIIHTASDKGVLPNTDLYISDGFIMQIGQSLNITNKHTLIDGQGRHLTPGLINASTQLGLVEINAAPSTVDFSTENKQQGASFAIAPAINFRSTLIPQNRINGLTRAIVNPVGGTSIFQGEGAAIALLSNSSGLVSEKVAQYARYGISGANVSGGSRASAYHVLNKALEEADYLRHNRSHYLPGYDWHFSQSVQDLDALKPVLEKKIPLVISVHRSDDILKMIELAKKHRIKIIIAGASEAWVVADEIARSGFPVLMDPLQNMPSSFESLANRLDAAAILHDAGVKLLFTGMQSTHNGYLVRQSAGSAVAYGMQKEEALKAMTINTAQAFGLKNFGQIKVGMEADLVVWDGEPLEITTNADLVIIKGILQPMVSRSTRLRDRYWDLKEVRNKSLVK